MIKLYYIEFFHKFLWCYPQVYNDFKEYEENNPTSKYLRSWNLQLKLDLARTFWEILLIISLEKYSFWYSIFEYLTRQ